MVFAENASMPNIMNTSQDIFLRWRTAMDDMNNFYAWLAAQADSDLENMGFSATDVGFLRAAYADGMAARAIIYNGLPPGGYPQPTAAHDYLVNIKQVIGPR